MENIEEQLQIFHRIDSLHKEALLNSFKGIMIDGYGQSGPTFRAYMHRENKFFANSDYYYKGSLEFFHLTSIQNLWSILNSRVFRLYNLNSSRDTEEYAYAAKILDLSEEFTEIRKRYSYTLSFCPFSEIRNQKIWEEYGKNFQGAAIVFTIENDPKDWIDFHLSEVKYNEPYTFQAYRNRVKEIESEYKGIDLSCDLSQLICFHKTAKWEGEKEIRIATYYPYKRVEEYLKFSKSEFRLERGRNRITNYIELPLWVNNESHLIKSHDSPDLNRTQNLPDNYFVTRPKIKIKDILIGINAGIQIEEFEKFRTALNDTIRYNYGYDIDITYDFFQL